ncbi:MAG: thioredoxin family protein [Syntrophorhabdales bacterium]
MAPVLDELAFAYAGRIKFVQLNVDVHHTTASQFRVNGVPTLYFYKNGSLVDSAQGALPKAEIERRLHMLLR